MWQLATWLVRAAIVAIAAVTGWIVGNGLGLAAGIALDAATGNDFVSWALLTIGLGGLLCIALGVWLGWRLARRVTTPRATAIAGAAVTVALVLGLFVVIPVAKGQWVPRWLRTSGWREDLTSASGLDLSHPRASAADHENLVSRLDTGDWSQRRREHDLIRLRQPGYAGRDLEVISTVFGVGRIHISVDDRGPGDKAASDAGTQCGIFELLRGARAVSK